MIRQTDLPASVHLCCLPIQLRQLNFRCCRRVGCRNVEFHIKLVFDMLINVPTRANPSRAVLIRLYLEPIRILFLLKLYKLYHTSKGMKEVIEVRKRTETEGSPLQLKRNNSSPNRGPKGGRRHTLMRQLYSSSKRCSQRSPSRGPALIFMTGS